MKARGVEIPERLEFGNPEHIRLVREAEARAARKEERARRVAEGPFRRYRVTYVVVEAADEEHARELVEEGDVPLDPEWEELRVEYVAAAGPEAEPAGKGPAELQMEFEFGVRGE